MGTEAVPHKDRHPRRKSPDHRPDDLLDEIERLGLESVLFCGEGLTPWAGIIKEQMGQRAIVCQVPASVRAESLAELAWNRLQEGKSDELDLLQPNYLRMPSIGAPKRRDRKRQSSAARARSSR